MGFCAFVVGHHQIDANLPKAGKRAEIRMNAVDGALVELEVAVQDVACRRLHEHAHRAGNGVIHGEEVDDETAQLYLIPALNTASFALTRCSLNLPSINPRVILVP